MKRREAGIKTSRLAAFFQPAPKTSRLLFIRGRRDTRLGVLGGELVIRSRFGLRLGVGLRHLLGRSWGGNVFQGQFPELKDFVRLKEIL